ncbi:MAG: hypothetical protein AB7K86_08345 [Rhodospirillales bacterium]
MMKISSLDAFSIALTDVGGTQALSRDFTVVARGTGAALRFSAYPQQSTIVIPLGTVVNGATPANQSALVAALTALAPSLSMRRADLPQEMSGIGGPSSRYLTMLPLNQLNGHGPPRDISGKNLTPVLGVALAESAAWANPGWLTTAAGSGTPNLANMYIPREQMALTMDATRGLLISFTVAHTADAAQWYACGIADTTQAGFYFLISAAGKGYFDIYSAAGTGNRSRLGPTLADMDIPAGIVITLAMDGPSKTGAIYVNGNLDLSGADLTHLYWSQHSSFSFALGAACQPFGTTYGAKFANLHILEFPGGLPGNVGRLVQRLAARPASPLTIAEVGA